MEQENVAKRTKHELGSTGKGREGDFLLPRLPREPYLRLDCAWPLGRTIFVKLDSLVWMHEQ